MPRCTVPASPSTNTFASTLRTPSTKADRSEGRQCPWRDGSVATPGHRLRPSGSTTAVPSTSPMASVGLPYSGAHDSTAKRTRTPYLSIRSTAAPVGVLVTSKRTGSRSASSVTWVTRPTVRPRGSQVLERTGDRVEGVGVEGAEPLVEEDRLQAGRTLGRRARSGSSARASASDSDARNVSPPDSVRA